MDLNGLVTLFTGFLESMTLLANAREIIDIILASLKKYFGKAEDPAEEPKQA